MIQNRPALQTCFSPRPALDLNLTARTKHHLVSLQTHLDTHKFDLLAQLSHETSGLIRQCGPACCKDELVQIGLKLNEKVSCGLISYQYACQIKQLLLIEESWLVVVPPAYFAPAYVPVSTTYFGCAHGSSVTVYPGVDVYPGIGVFRDDVIVKQDVCVPVAVTYF